MRRLLIIVTLAGLLAASCSGGDIDTAELEPTREPTPSGADSQPTASPVPRSTPTAAPVVDLQQLADLAGVEPAPFGTYLVAKAEAGVLVSSVPGVAERRHVPVYDEPGGQPRTLLAINHIDGIEVPRHLVNLADPAGVLVLRVLAGGPDDEWILVQAPTRPHDRYVWVRGEDFAFGHTATRIEIDLAGEGKLQLFDGDQLTLESRIAQGRDEGRSTPTHVTYVEQGVLGERVRPAYGLAILSMASYSEQLGTFGEGGLPSNFLYEATVPEVLGQRVSSGSIRLPLKTVEALIEFAAPGTPVLMFDSSGARPTRDQIVRRMPERADTVAFDPHQSGARDAVTGVAPQLWRRCVASDAPNVALLCRTDGSWDLADVGLFDPFDNSENLHNLVSREHVIAVAKPGAGQHFILPGESVPDGPEELPLPIIPVFDEPHGSPRALTFSNDIDGVEFEVPLHAETVFGEPLVLSVLQMTTDGRWLLVRAPVLPHNQAVWVEGEHFELQSTTVRVEVDIGYEFVGQQGILTVWDGNQELLTAKISAGRESRPTVLTSTYVDQIIPGDTLSPAYGPWLLSTPSFSESLGTFGGGGIPQTAIHGISDELDVLGQPQSSGSIHVSYETAARLAETDGILGARVILYDSSTGRGGLPSVLAQPLTAAETTTPTTRDTPVGSFT